MAEGERMLRRFLISTLVVFLAISATAMATEAYPGENEPQVASTVVPPQLQGIGVTQHLGKKINLNLQFTSSTGKMHKLADFFNRKHPVVMAMVYYRCRNLCGYLLMGLAKTFKQMKVKAGKFYSMVIVSMDPTETPQMAAAKKTKVMKMLGEPGAVKHWHFMVGNKANVHALADELGFHYKWDAQLKEFAHPTAAYILTSKGKITRYLFGIDFPAETMRLSLVQAGQGQVGRFTDELALCCFRFSSSDNKYILWSFNLMRIACVITVIILAIVLLPAWIKGRKRSPEKSSNPPAGP